MKWYLLAAEQKNHKTAQFRIEFLFEKGLGVEVNYYEAMKWYLLAAKQNHKTAQNRIGFMYKNGLGVKVNYSEAIKWYLLAAEKNHFMVSYIENFISNLQQQ